VCPRRLYFSLGLWEARAYSTWPTRRMHWGSNFLWSIQPGHHPLQLYVRSQLLSLSRSLFGLEHYGCLLLPKPPCVTPFLPILQCLHSSRLTLSKSLTLPVLTVADFQAAFIWGDPTITLDSTPLVPTAAPARDLISRGIIIVAQLWDFPLQAWHPPDQVFPTPSPRLLTYYCRLLSSLISPSSLPTSALLIIRFHSSHSTFIYDPSDPVWPAFFSVDLSRQSLLVPHVPVPFVSPSSPALISQHKPTYLPSPQFHDYSTMPPLLF
jgi:hypothetical protein